MKTIVFLGAGASFGSIDALPHTPPLGNHLFKALEKLGGIAHAMPEDLKVMFRKNFELGMVSYYASTGGRIMAFHRELAGYLAQFSPGPNNAYISLVQLMGSQNTVYVSLNYDLLLEASIVRTGRLFLYEPSPPRGVFEVLKIHGSCNFWPDMGGNVVIGGEAALNRMGDVEAPVLTLHQQATLVKCANNVGFAPALAMYAEGKEVRVCPGYIDEQQNRWRQHLTTAGQVIIIGVKVNPNDSHIWEALAATSAKITYFGLQSDQKEFTDWACATNNQDAAFVEGDFEMALQHLAARRMG